MNSLNVMIQKGATTAVANLLENPDYQESMVEQVNILLLLLSLLLFLFLYLYLFYYCRYYVIIVIIISVEILCWFVNRV